MKKWKYFLSLFLLMFLLCSCEKEEKSGESYIYYVNIHADEIVAQPYAFVGTTVEEKIQEALRKLQEKQSSVDVKQTLPEDIVVDYEWSGMLTLDFSEEYELLKERPTEEALVRAAIVKTLVQIEGVDYVAFEVQGNPLMDVTGRMVGTMSSESFVENPGKQINSIQEAVLTLYFSNEEGTALVKEVRTVHYSSNKSLEKLVMEQLLAGPKKKVSKATIPSETKLLNISVAENVCYVNLDEAISGKNSQITEQVVLYSIVNSLTELNNVNKVQISINGDTKGKKLRYVYDLSAMYEADFSYMESVEKNDTQVETQETEAS